MKLCWMTGLLLAFCAASSTFASAALGDGNREFEYGRSWQCSTQVSASVRRSGDRLNVSQNPKDTPSYRLEPLTKVLSHANGFIEKRVIIAQALKAFATRGMVLQENPDNMEISEIVDILMSQPGDGAIASGLLFLQYAENDPSNLWTWSACETESRWTILCKREGMLGEEIFRLSPLTGYFSSVALGDWDRPNDAFKENLPARVMYGTCW